MGRSACLPSNEACTSLMSPARTQLGQLLGCAWLPSEANRAELIRHLETMRLAQPTTRQSVPNHRGCELDEAEKLVDLETAFRFWRFRHVTTVERIIGFKTGTGGTAGVSYLRKMLDVVLFPELFALRTAL